VEEDAQAREAEASGETELALAPPAARTAEASPLAREGDEAIRGPHLRENLVEAAGIEPGIEPSKSSENRDSED
jgi:hypothetical protein